MKYLYIVVAMILMGCSEKSPEPIKVAEVKAEVVEVVQTEVVKVKEVPAALAPNETLVEETKVTKNIGSDIPSSCAMWSDGCNVCTRIGNGKASCTTGPDCKNKMFSCLQWQ